MQNTIISERGNRFLIDNIYMKSIPFTKIILAFIFFYLAWYWIEFREESAVSYQTRSLDKDGFCVLIDKEYMNTTDIPCKKLQNDVLHALPPGYIFIDYIYKINNTSLSTFHRDVTSSQQIYHTKHPVYTLILYKYNGELLSICPHSNKTYPFVTSNIVNITGDAGTAFLFDCELLHAGMKNNCKERQVLQYKLCHSDDMHLLLHLDKINNTKSDVCKMNLYETFIRKISYYFQFPINVLLYPLMIKRENNNNNAIGFIQSFIPVTFYNNV
jgi:hypothetical protein